MDCWPTKDPDENLDYYFDWTDRLEAGETISTSSFELASGDVVLGVTDVVATTTDGVTTTYTQVWISGGTANTVSVVTNRITTSEGRVYDKSGRLRVRSK